MLKQHLNSAVESLTAAASCDVDGLSGAAAAEMLGVIASLEGRLAALRMALGKRAVDGNVHVVVGARDGASWLASVTGQTVDAARSDLATASRLQRLDDVAAACAAGELSATQMHSVAAAADADPSRQRDLLSAAATSSVAGLKKACRSVVAQQSSAAEEADRWDRLKQKRSFRTWTDADSMFCGEFKMLPTDGAQLLAKLKPFVNRAFKAARAEGRYERHAAYQADALVALVESSGGEARKARAEVVVIADHEAWVRGYAADGERCEIEGVGSVPVTAVKAMAEDCFLSSVLVKDGKPVLAKGKAHYIPDRLRVAVKLRDRCCVVPGCDSEFRLEIDHIIPVAERGPTVLENLRQLCKSHHDLRTYRGFDIVADDEGRRRWVQLRPPQQNPWKRAS